MRHYILLLVSQKLCLIEFTKENCHSFICLLNKNLEKSPRINFGVFLHWIKVKKQQDESESASEACSSSAILESTGLKLMMVDKALLKNVLHQLVRES